jgi:hypothetical protein
MARWRVPLRPAAALQLRLRLVRTFFPTLVCGAGNVVNVRATMSVPPLRAQGCGTRSCGCGLPTWPACTASACPIGAAQAGATRVTCRQPRALSHRLKCQGMPWRRAADGARGPPARAGLGAIWAQCQMHRESSGHRRLETKTTHNSFFHHNNKIQTPASCGIHGCTRAHLKPTAAARRGPATAQAGAAAAVAARGADGAP